MFFPVPQVVSKFSKCPRHIRCVFSVAIAGNVERLAPFTMKCLFFVSFFVSLWTSHRAASPCSFVCCRPKKISCLFANCGSTPDGAG